MNIVIAPPDNWNNRRHRQGFTRFTGKMARWLEHNGRRGRWHCGKSLFPFRKCKTMAVSLPPVPSDQDVALRVWPGPSRAESWQVENCEPVSFGDLNVAFQHATGWRLSWQPRHLLSDGTCSRKRHDWLRIDDLSSLLPPGLPVTSRIYCEHLVLRWNRLLDELVQSSDLPTGDETSANARGSRCLVISQAGSRGER